MAEHTECPGCMTAIILVGLMAVVLWLGSRVASIEAQLRCLQAQSGPCSVIK